MAKLKKAKPKPKQSTVTVSTDRKMEILGLALIAVSIMLLLSIFTYSNEDWGVIHESAGSLLQQEKQIDNGLSITGAFIAHYLVYQLFGYFSAFIPVLMGVLGWFIFRFKDLNLLIKPTIKALWGMLLLSIWSAWLLSALDAQNVAFYGNTAWFISDLLKLIVGFWGSLIFLIAASIATILAIIKFDVQAQINAFKEKIAARKQAKADQSVQQAPQAEETSKPKTVAVPPTKKEVVPDIEPESDSAEPQEEEQQKSIEEILAASREREAAIEARKAEEEAALANEKPKADLVSNDESEEDEGEPEPEMEVYQGEEEAEAGRRDLDKSRKENESAKPTIRYRYPSIELLDEIDESQNQIDFEEIENNKRIILEKLGQHKIEIRSIQAIVGPTVTLYELEPAPHVKIGKIESYANDLKMATASHGIRIIAPIPGKSAVGIEVPNQTRQTVSIRQVINTKKFADAKMELPVAFGKTIENELFMADLTKMPHLLVAGATGSGKSVGINTIITCLLYKCHPDNLKFVMIDPKKIELSLYRAIERHFLATLPNAEEPIITDTSKALELLQSTTIEMDMRYDLLKLAGSRNIKEYNAKLNTGKLDPAEGHRHLPYIVVIIDELADLMMTAGKQIEEPIARLAQLARAIGIHLVVATQRPSVNVITGTIKANFPARIAYQVASKVDSRTILDSMGADQLVGKGDMLFTNGGAGGMTRLQNAFVSTEEVERLTDFIGKQEGYNEPYLLPEVEDENAADASVLDDKDSMFEEAAKVLVLHQQGSVSLIQRKLKLGYNRAGRIIDQLFAAGIVGPYKGSTAREVLVADEEELLDILRNL